MSVDQDPQKEISALRALISYHNKKYYIDAEPVIDDYEYDAMFRKLQELEAKYPKLVNAKSPTQTVGAIDKKKMRTATHTTPMLSLKTETDYTAAGALAFVNRVSELLSPSERPMLSYVAEPKYDGLGLDLTYRRGKLVQALTRGDGVIGEVVTENAKMIESIPQTIKTPKGGTIEYLQVRGEVVMHKSVFSDINSNLIAKGEKPYVNARNAASGALRQLDPLVTKSRRLSFYAYTLVAIQPYNIHKNHSSQMALLEDIGFTLSEEIRVLESAEDLVGYHEHILSIRDQLPYEIDGVVYKVDDLNLQYKLGFISREPKWAVAHKFLAEEKTTKLLGIDVQVGRTGKLTPVARLEPVFVSGTTITNVTLHNVFDLRGRKVRIGDTVSVRRAGDVIPEIVGYVKEDRKQYLPNFHMPKKCPVCGGHVERIKGTREYRCTNKLSCPAQVIGAITHYASKRAMNIEGLGEKTVEQLVQQGIISDLRDIYKLKNKKDELSGVAGFGAKTQSNLFSAVEYSKDCTFSKFLYALGISNVGEGTSKTLANKYKDLYELERASQEELMSIPDIGPISAKSVKEFLDSLSFYTAKDLYANHLRVTNGKGYTSAKLANLTFVITGSFSGVSRDEIKQLIENSGGRVASSVGSATSYLVAGEAAGSKLDKAKQLGKSVINYDELKEMIK